VLGSRYSVMLWLGQFEQFLAADPVQPQDLDGGERPERFLFFVGQVASFTGSDVVGPDESSDRLGGECFSQISVGAVDHRAGFSRLRCGQQSGRGPTPVVGGAHEHGQHGQPFAGALVHAGLAVLEVLGFLHFGVGDRAGRDPRPPPSGILDSPVRDIEVERPHSDQLVLEIQTRHRHLAPLAGGADRGAFDGAELVFPGAHNLGRKLQGGDAGSQCLDAGPEQPGQCPRDSVEAGEVQ
jgi:hypothetical protein